ncbi:sugar transferase [Sulfitobacter sp. KE29]|uniref:sugar transferase n=1 Tax=unclassified Sulfitobacter TaxID=196795 RepID=UPI0023E108F3|nr:MULTISPECIES: sugar transferase [unclassified Sulfitobacter]MDF3418562.1 sugar transferase [Sulfitobacter sp. Ks38]MDF3426352.1 sugar transferase [Sulfitobacter sp. KE29]MDF3429933.1 sugar transferase [Sulfitobacter sp. S46]MDF3444397.1 sugar transferase [Sulfitobacter sp. KE31]MDF3548422.1 sugar transferase [Sulfitobacter sp. KE28]|tara:strand:+ start:410 stop:997 length:588 start_codon:yes stop_codon:yes gene_type:complete
MLFDLGLGLMLLPVLLPVILVLCTLVAMDGGLPIFGHRRIGKGGREFRCWKIRTMVVDAEERLKKHLADNPEAAAEWEQNFKLENDPRITRMGRFLRKSSLDELPQLFNVFRGEMSFVGPRPVVRDELLRYGLHQQVYMSMRPGVTGLWQVSGRNDVAYDQRVSMDVQYAREVSLVQDARIVAKTVTSVLSLTGK